MLKTRTETLYALYVTILVLLTLVDDCIGQGFYSDTRRSDVRAPYNQAYDDGQWQSVLDRQAQLYVNNEYQNTFTNNVRNRDNLQNTNSLNYRPSTFYDRNSQTNGQYRDETYRQQQPQMIYSQGESNAYANISPYSNRASSYSGERLYPQSFQNTGHRVPQQSEQTYQTSERHSNIYNDVNRGDPNRINYPVTQNQQPQRYQMTNNDVYASNSGRNYVPGTMGRPYSSQGTRDTNVLVASPQSRFNGERNEFQYRSANVRTNVANEPFDVTAYTRRSRDSLSVPMNRYGASFRIPYGRTYNIPEATSLPRGLEFAGRSYESKRRDLLGGYGNIDNHWSRQSNIVSGMTATALGRLLGLSTTSITDIASKPSVFVRSMQSARRPHYPMTDVEVVVEEPNVHAVSGNNRVEAKANLLADIGHTLNQLGMEDKLSLYKDLDSNSVQPISKYKYDMPVQMIIISDSNTFSQLQADAATPGSFIGALPPSAIDENLLVGTSSVEPPNVVVRNSPDQIIDRGKQRGTSTKTTVRTKNNLSSETTVRVVTNYITKPPSKASSEHGTSGSPPGTTPRRNTNGNSRVAAVDTTLHSGNNELYNDGFVNSINDRRW